MVLLYTSRVVAVLLLLLLPVLQAQRVLWSKMLVWYCCWWYGTCVILTVLTVRVERGALRGAGNRKKTRYFGDAIKGGNVAAPLSRQKDRLPKSIVLLYVTYVLT